MESNLTAQTRAVETVQKSLAQSLELILAENKQALSKINYQTVEQLAGEIAATAKIFVYGEGRSGLVIRMVAMRLMHLGYQVYVVGETITPSIKAGDLLITCSGSGSTGNVLSIAAKAQELGARLVAVTIEATSPLGKIADLVVEIEAAAKLDHSHQISKQFAGSLFEQSTLLLFDALFQFLAQNLNKNAQTLWALHTNLE